MSQRSNTLHIPWVVSASADPKKKRWLIFYSVPTLFASSELHFGTPNNHSSLRIPRRTAMLSMHLPNARGQGTGSIGSLGRIAPIVEQCRGVAGE